MDVILGLVMIVFGVLSLFRGELKISADSVATGARARAAAILLIIGLPLAFLVGLVRAAAEQAAHRPLFGEVLPGLLSYIVLFGCAVAAVVVVKLGSKNTSTGA